MAVTVFAIEVAHHLALGAECGRHHPGCPCRLYFGKQVHPAAVIGLLLGGVGMVLIGSVGFVCDRGRNGGAASAPFSGVGVGVLLQQVFALARFVAVRRASRPNEMGLPWRVGRVRVGGESSGRMRTFSLKMITTCLIGRRGLRRVLRAGVGSSGRSGGLPLWRRVAAPATRRMVAAQASSRLRYIDSPRTWLSVPRSYWPRNDLSHESIVTARRHRFPGPPPAWREEGKQRAYAAIGMRAAGCRLGHTATQGPPGSVLPHSPVEPGRQAAGCFGVESQRRNSSRSCWLVLSSS